MVMVDPVDTRQNGRGDIAGWDFRDRDDDVPTLAPKRGKMDPALAREVRREARYYYDLIPQILADVGYDHWLRKESRPEPIERILFGRTSRQMVKIVSVAYNETNIFFQIDPVRLPYRVTIPMLMDPGVLETLSFACKRRVTYQARSPEKGFWLVLHRIGVLSSIPKLLPFKDAINNVKSGADPLVYCAGVTENMRLIMANLETMPHMLVGGSTRMGKSVYLHATLCQLLWRNSPEQLRLLLIDLKGGMELQDYRSVPHLWKPIVTTIEDVVPALMDYHKEMKHRQDLFAGHARSLSEFNAVRGQKLPYIVMVIDELAQILSNPNREMARDAMLELGLILATARATGGHCILCTQYPSVKVVDGYLKSNLDTRIAFKTATQSDSRVIIDTSDAAALPIPGRAIFLNGAERVQIQAPWISPTLIRRTVKAIMEREHAQERKTIGIVQLIELALDEFEGSMAVRDLYDRLKDQVSQASIVRMLSEFEGEVIEVRSQNYVITPGGPRVSRRAELVEFESPDPDIDTSLTEPENGNLNPVAPLPSVPL